MKATNYKNTATSTDNRTSVYELVIEMPTSWRGNTQGEKLMQYVYRGVPNKPLPQLLPQLIEDPSIGGALLRKFAPDSEVSSLLRGNAYLYTASKHKDRWGKKVREKHHLHRVSIETYALVLPNELKNIETSKNSEITPVVIHAVYRDWNGVYQSKALPLIAFIRRVYIEDADSFPQPTLALVDYKRFVNRVTDVYAALVAADAARIEQLYNDCFSRHQERKIDSPNKFCISHVSGLERLERPNSNLINIADFVLRAIKYKLANAPRTGGFSEIEYVVRLMEGKSITDTFLENAPKRTEQTMPKLVDSVVQEGEETANKPDWRNETVTEDDQAWVNEPDERPTKVEPSIFKNLKFEWHKPGTQQSGRGLYTDKQVDYMVALVRNLGGDPLGADGFYDWLRKLLDKGNRYMSRKTASEIIADLKEGKHVFFGSEDDLEILKNRIERRRANRPNPYKKYVGKPISVINNLYISKLLINSKPEYKYDRLNKGHRLLVHFFGKYYPNTLLGTYTDPKTGKRLDFGIKGSIHVTQKKVKDKWEVVSIETKNFDTNAEDYELFPSDIKEDKHFLDALRAAINVKVKRAAYDYFVAKNEKYDDPDPDWRNETVTEDDQAWVNEPDERPTKTKSKQPIKQPAQPPAMPKARKTAYRKKVKDDFKPIQSSQRLVSAIRAFKQYEGLRLYEKDANSLYYRISEALLDAKKGDHFAPLGREIQRKLDKIRQSTASWPTQTLKFTKPTSYKLMCFERDCRAAWSKIQLGSVASAADVAAANFQTWTVPGLYGSLLGNVADGFHLVIWGLPGSGKSTFALGLANALAEVGSTLYISAEEGAGATMQERLRRVGAAPNLFISGAGSVDQARSTIAGGDFRFVVLDSVDTLRASVEDVERLKQDFPNVAFITIHQATKLNQMRGSLEYAHNADVIVRVDSGKAETTKNRYAPLNSVNVAFNGISARDSNRTKPARRLAKSGRSTKDGSVVRKLKPAGSVVSFRTRNGKKVEFCAKTTKAKPSGRCFSGLGKATSCNTNEQTSAEIMFQGCAEPVSINDALEADISFKANDKYAEITKGVISAIEKGIGNGVWELPWTKSLAATGRPFNPITGRFYRGMNMLQLLTEFSKVKMYNANYWATPKQWQEAGFELAPLKRKKTGMEVMWVEIGRMKKDNGQLTYRKSFELVNSFFVKGAEDHFADNTVRLNDPITNLPEDIMKLVQSTGAEVKWAKSARGAWYSPSFDYINMPPKGSFKEQWRLVSTLVHELVHWTGHESRLNRIEKIGKRYVNDSYAFEELVAELGATFICADYGITNTLREDHVKYLAGWLDAFKRNSRILFEASNLAQEAVEYIYAFSNTSLKGLECASCFDIN